MYTLQKTFVMYAVYLNMWPIFHYINSELKDIEEKQKSVKEKQK